jgi:hypothetical protein
MAHETEKGFGSGLRAQLERKVAAEEPVEEPVEEEPVEEPEAQAGEHHEQQLAALAEPEREV